MHVQFEGCIEGEESQASHIPPGTATESSRESPVPMEKAAGWDMWRIAWDSQVRVRRF